MKKIVIFGAGDIAELAHFYFDATEDFEVVGFAVDEEFKKSDSFCNLPLVGMGEMVRRFPPGEFAAFAALSYRNMNKFRESKCLALKELGYELVSYISPFCTNFAKSIGENCFILEDNTLQPFVTIGNNVTLWSGNHIGHHSQIKDNCFITSHVVVSGGVIVENNCFIGVNATIRDHVRIGRETLISAAAIIMNDTEERSLYRAERTPAHSKHSDEIGF